MAGLNARSSGLGREPPELRGLRVYSNYLTPKLGVLSADTWALAALYVRNLFLNWIVYLPLIVAVILLPICAQSVLTAAVLWPPIVHQSFMGLACLLLVLALYTSLRGRQGATKAERVSQGDFLRLELLPLYAAALLVCVYSVAAYRYDPTQTLISPITIPIAALGVRHAPCPHLDRLCRAIRPVLAARLGDGNSIPVLAGCRRHRRRLIGWGLAIADSLMNPAGGVGIDHGTRLLAIFGVGWIAGSLFVAEAIYLGLTSYTPRGDDEREWLARSSGWFLALTLGWGLLSALVLFAADIRALLQSGFWALFPVSAGAGAIAAGIGSSAQTLASLVSSKKGESVSMTTILSVASLLFLVTMTIILATVVLTMLPWWANLLDLGPTSKLSVIGIGLSVGTPAALAVAAAIVLCAAIVLLASVPINVNRFSSHSLYRNRLARAFLGSARGDEEQDSQTRDPLTGFDAKDNPRMAELATPTNRPRLYHVVNMALNVVSGKNNAWQERKAEPFIVSPKAVGNEYVGFCRTDKFGSPDGGITLGTCMAISGAAASPNQGYHSSPLIGLIMTLFNVRLGWWLGNPQHPEKAVRAGPRWGILPSDRSCRRLFGLTTDDEGTTSTFPTADTSKISASTRWCAGDAVHHRGQRRRLRPGTCAFEDLEQRRSQDRDRFRCQDRFPQDRNPQARRRQGRALLRARPHPVSGAQGDRQGRRLRALHQARLPPMTEQNRLMFVPMRSPTSNFPHEPRRTGSSRNPNWRAIAHLGLHRRHRAGRAGRCFGQDRSKPGTAALLEHLSEYIVQYDKQAAVQPAG